MSLFQQLKPAKDGQGPGPTKAIQPWADSGIMAGMNSTQAKELFDHFFEAKVEQYFQEKSTLNESLLYSLLAPGKRLRPLLCLGFTEGLKGRLEVAQVCAVSVEMIHTYSLIHDDLPAMDNDDFRRGRLTNHKVYGEAMAILAGDALLTFAPEFLLRELSLLKIPAGLSIELTTSLLQLSGPNGMVKGQALDMKFEVEDHSTWSKVDLEKGLKNIHLHKTAGLMTWSCLAGLYSHSDEDLIRRKHETIHSVGQKIGLMFQIVDDVLDVTSSLKDLGKTPGKDQKVGKLTYTNLLGIEGATSEARNLILSIREDLERFARDGGNWTIIHEIINSLEAKLPH